MRTQRILHAIGVVLLAGTLMVAFPGLSSAVFSATTRSTATVTAAHDWTPPTVAVDALGSWVRGTVQVSVTARDERSAVAKVAVETQPANGAWAALCARTAAPYACAWDTTKVADGAYAVRATADDTAGYSATSAAVTTRVDNTAPAVALTAPAATLSGTVTFAGTASDAGSGIATVVLQRAATGSTTWTDVCTATAAPWSCAVDTRTLTDGRHDFRAVATDRAGNTTTSAVATNRTVDNVALAGADIQTTNGGTPGRPDAGDTVVYTFNREVNLGSIRSGWTGGAQSVTAELDAGSDTLTVPGANLGTVQLNQDYVGGLGLSFRSTMTAATVNGPDGRPRTVVTVRFDSISWGWLIGANTVTTADTMTWSPSASVTDLLGRPSSTAPVTETGPLDREF